MKFLNLRQNVLNLWTKLNTKVKNNNSEDAELKSIGDLAVNLIVKA